MYAHRRAASCTVDHPGEGFQARAQLGVTPQLDNLDVTLTVEQNLLVFTDLEWLGRFED